jgi:hypothetical protein
VPDGLVLPPGSDLLAAGLVGPTDITAVPA